MLRCPVWLSGSGVRLARLDIVLLHYLIELSELSLSSLPESILFKGLGSSEVRLSHLR